MTVIAIDGPAASGKSTVARLLAERLGFCYVNSGSMYRALTWHIMQAGVRQSAPERLAEILKAVVFDCGLKDGGTFISINGKNPETHLHSETVNRNVSWVSGVPEVRNLLLNFLRSFAKESDIVMEGRDIGSVVFPDTPYKFYLDALPEVRRRRRSAQGQVDEIASRDKQDSSRAAAPLRVARDAIVIDSTHLTQEGVVTEILGRLAGMGLTAQAP